MVRVAILRGVLSLLVYIMTASFCVARRIFLPCVFFVEKWLGLSVGVLGQPSNRYEPFRREGGECGRLPSPLTCVPLHTHKKNVNRNQQRLSLKKEGFAQYQPLTRHSSRAPCLPPKSRSDTILRGNQSSHGRLCFIPCWGLAWSL